MLARCTCFCFILAIFIALGVEPRVAGLKSLSSLISRCFVSTSLPCVSWVGEREEGRGDVSEVLLALLCFPGGA